MDWKRSAPLPPRLARITWLALLLGGCDDASEPPSDVLAPLDATVPDADPPAPDGRAPPDALPDAMVDAAPPPDASGDVHEVDAAPADAGVTRVDDCASACARFEACGEIEALFRDAAACRQRCGEIEEGAPSSAWFDCVQTARCGELVRCRPPAIEPPSCAAVCAAANECGAELPFGCEAACAERPGTVEGCAPTLEGCRIEAFVGCHARAAYPGCVEACDRRVECRLTEPEGCLADCVATRSAPDPLIAWRADVLDRCLEATADCAGVEACERPRGALEAVDEDAFCALFAGCGYGGGCEVFHGALRRRGEGTVPCAADRLRRGCPEAPEVLFDLCGGRDPLLDACEALCVARDVCGVAEMGLDACVNGCGVVVDEPDARERAAPTAACAGAETCVELTGCVASTGPQAECRAHCRRLAACGRDGANCEARCEDAWPRDRHGVWRACVAEAGDDCAAQVECARPVAAPCAAHCDRVRGCGLEGRECEARCDDGFFADPDIWLRRIACAITAPGCFEDGFRQGHAVAPCLNDPREHGRACLNFCRNEALCRHDAEVELEGCMVECARGLVGDVGLRFTAAEPCLRALPADAACESISACVPGIVRADCAGFCERATACGVELDACRASCEGDALARLRVIEISACAGPDPGCVALSACARPPARPPRASSGPTREALCAAWDACRTGVPCEAVELALPGAVARQCVFEALARGCPDEPFALLDTCGSTAHPLAGPCARLCRARDFCGLLDDPIFPGRQECERRCRAQLDRADPDGVRWLWPALACADAWSCAELPRCEDAAQPHVACPARCAAVSACAGEDPDCEPRCLARWPRARSYAWRDCVDAADDCEALGSCGLAPAPACVDACAEAEVCAPDPRCVARCDDDLVDRPDEGADRLDCVDAAPECADVAVCLAP